jgi:CubicO group peptidase (beta-lactamase class C family)
LTYFAMDRVAVRRAEAERAAAAAMAARDREAAGHATRRPGRRTWRLGALALLVALVITFARSSGGPQAPLDLGDDAAVAALFDALLTEQVARPDVPGAVLAVVHGGALRHVAGYGHADVGADVPMDGARTLVRPGSAAKPITWTAVMLLAHRGAVDLHADVQQYLDFDLPGGFGEPVTLAHLITHTAGFEDVGEKLFVLDPAERWPLATYLRELAPARVHPPGAVQAYSNYGTALAGYVVERVSGVPFEVFVERHVFAPAGMAQATYAQPPVARDDAGLAVGYGWRDGGLVPGRFEVVTPVPAGGLSATAADLGRFALAHLGHGDALPDAVRAAMQEPAWAPDPRMRGVTYGFMDAAVRGVRVLHHEGDTYLFRSALVLLPEHDLGWFVSYNGPGGGAARRELLEAVVAALVPTAPPLRPVADGTLGGALVGEFHLARAEHSGMGKVLTPLLAAAVRTERDGRLTVTVDGRSATYLPHAEDVYRHAERDDLLVVARGSDGRTWLHFDAGPPFEAFIATSAVQAPWYASRGALAATLLLPVLAYAGAAAGGAFAGWRRRRRGERLSGAWRRVRAATLATGAAHATFLVAFAALLLDVEPAYGVPRVLFGATAALGWVTWVPWVLALAAAGSVAAVAAASGLRPGARVADAVVAAPRTGTGRPVGRTVRALALATLSWASLASLAYWNVWRWPT